MTIKIQVQGPIHTIPKWNGKSCVDYGGSNCSWEAKITLTVQMDFATVIEQQRELWANTSAPAGMPHGRAMDQAKLSGGLFLIQEVIKFVTIAATDGTCETYTESFMDMWELPSSGSEAIRVDRPTLPITWSLLCTASKDGCILTTAWKARVYVAFVMRSDAKKVRDVELHPASDDNFLWRQGTVADVETRDSHRPPPTKVDSLGLLGSEDRVASVVKPTPEQYKATHDIQPVQGETAYYEMNPVVPHCMGSSDRKAKNVGKDVGHNGIPAEDNNGSPVEAYKRDELKKLNLGRDDDGPILPPSKGVVIRDSFATIEIRDQWRRDLIVAWPSSPALGVVQPQSIQSLGEFWAARQEMMSLEPDASLTSPELGMPQSHLIQSLGEFWAARQETMPVNPFDVVPNTRPPESP